MAGSLLRGLFEELWELIPDTSSLVAQCADIKRHSDGNVFVSESTEPTLEPAQKIVAVVRAAIFDQLNIAETKSELMAFVGTIDKADPSALQAINTWTPSTARGRRVRGDCFEQGAYFVIVAILSRLEADRQLEHRFAMQIASAVIESGRERQRSSGHRSFVTMRSEMRREDVVAGLEAVDLTTNECAVDRVIDDAIILALTSDHQQIEPDFWLIFKPIWKGANEPGDGRPAVLRDIAAICGYDYDKYSARIINILDSGKELVRLQSPIDPGSTTICEPELLDELKVSIKDLLSSTAADWHGGTGCRVQRLEELQVRTQNGCVNCNHNLTDIAHLFDN